MSAMASVMHALRELNDTRLKHIKNLCISIMFDGMGNRTASTATYSTNSYKNLYVFDDFSNPCPKHRLFTKVVMFTFLFFYANVILMFDNPARGGPRYPNVSPQAPQFGPGGMRGSD